MLCSRCRAEIHEADNYCHNCGKSLKPGRGFLFTHTGIILMALVLGPFALPFVWLSKVLSPLAKIIYTVLLLIFGFYLVYSLFHMFSLVQESMQTLLGDLDGLENGLHSVQSLGSL
jgi:hypothetical protein